MQDDSIPFEAWRELVGEPSLEDYRQVASKGVFAESRHVDLFLKRATSDYSNAIIELYERLLMNNKARSDEAFAAAESMDAYELQVNAASERILESLVAMDSRIAKSLSLKILQQLYKSMLVVIIEHLLERLPYITVLTSIMIADYIIEYKLKSMLNEFDWSFVRVPELLIDMLVEIQASQGLGLERLGYPPDKLKAGLTFGLEPCISLHEEHTIDLISSFFLSGEWHGIENVLGLVAIAFMNSHRAVPPEAFWSAPSFWFHGRPLFCRSFFYRFLDPSQSADLLKFVTRDEGGGLRHFPNFIYASTSMPRDAIPHMVCLLESADERKRSRVLSSFRRFASSWESPDLALDTVADVGLELLDRLGSQQFSRHDSRPDLWVLVGLVALFPDLAKATGYNPGHPAIAKMRRIYDRLAVQWPQTPDGDPRNFWTQFEHGWSPLSSLYTCSHITNPGFAMWEAICTIGVDPRKVADILGLNFLDDDYVRRIPWSIWHRDHGGREDWLKWQPHIARALTPYGLDATPPLGEKLCKSGLLTTDEGFWLDGDRGA